MFTSARNMFRVNKFTWYTFLIDMFGKVLFTSFVRFKNVSSCIIFSSFCTMYAFSRHQCAWNYSPEVCGKYCPKYFAFGPWQKTDVEFLHPPLFVLKISFSRSTSLGYFDFSPHQFQPPCLTCLVWSWSKLPHEVVSIMIGLNKFWSCFAQCTA